VEIKTKLVALLHRAFTEEDRFIASLSEGERAEPGSLERWSAKDVLAHITAWHEYEIARIDAAARGELRDNITDIDHVNAGIYHNRHDQTLDQAAAALQATRKALLERVEAMSEAQLLDPDFNPWRDNRPTWMTLCGHAFTHPILHLAQYYVEHGQVERSMDMQEAAADTLLQIDDTPVWRGTTLYNLACACALAGQSERAAALLQDSLQLNPGLVEWSKSDPDLVSLRAGPGDRSDLRERS